MDERLWKRYEILRSLLLEARSEIDPNESAGLGGGRLASSTEFMEHREFELALDTLQDVGGEYECSVTFWRRLKQAADVMGLDDRRNHLRSRYRNTLKRTGAA